MFAFSRPIDRAAPTIADTRHAKSSAVVMGRLSSAVSGLGIGMRDMWWAGSGCMRVASESCIMSASASDHGLGRRLNMLRENCLWRLFDGTAREARKKFLM